MPPRGGRLLSGRSMWGKHGSMGARQAVLQRTLCNLVLLFLRLLTGRTSDRTNNHDQHDRTTVGHPHPLLCTCTRRSASVSASASGRMLCPTNTAVITITQHSYTSTHSHSHLHSHSHDQQYQHQHQHQIQQQHQQQQQQPCQRYLTCPHYPHKHFPLPRPCVQVQVRSELSDELNRSLSRIDSAVYTSTSTETTLSQRLRRAIIQDDLPAAKRVAKLAVNLAETRSQRTAPVDGSGLGKARRREWVRQRRRLREVGEDCLVPVRAGPHDKEGTERLVFDIRNVKTQDLQPGSPCTSTATATAPSLYPPLGGSKLPAAPLPLDSLVAEQDARKTSLQLAIEYRCSVEMVEWLLQCGHEEEPAAHPPGDDTGTNQRKTLRLTTDGYGRTLFHLAAIFDRADIMQVYYGHIEARLSEEASLSWSGEHDDTCLLGAQEHIGSGQDSQQPQNNLDSCHQAEGEVAHELRRDKSEREPVDSSKGRRCSDSLSLRGSVCSSSQEPAESGDTPLLRLINAPDELTSFTALHEAASRGFSDLSSLLLSYGARVDPLDCEGNSPLHHASANGHPTCVHLLIEKGANFGLRNCRGFSPADVAYTDSDRATLEALGRNSVALKKERRKEERMAKAAINSEKSRNGASVGGDESRTFEGESASASERSFTPDFAVGGGSGSGGGWGGENAFASLSLESSPLPAAARSTSALVTGRTAWFDEECLEDLLLGSNSNSTSVEHTSPRSRLASFPRLSSRNSTLMSAPLSPTDSPGSSGAGAGAGLLDARVRRLARRSSSALRLWAGYGLGRATSPALGTGKGATGSASAIGSTSMDDVSSTPDPRTLTSLSLTVSSSLGSPKALHAHHFIGHSPQPFRGNAQALSSPAAASSPSVATSPSTTAQRPHPSRPFRYLKASRSSTALATAFRQTAAPYPSSAAARAQTGQPASGAQDQQQVRSALRLRPRSIDLTTSTSLSLSVPGPDTRGPHLWTNNGGNGSTALTASLALAADDSATEELATPTSPVAEFGRDSGLRAYEKKKDKEKRKRNDSGRAEWGIADGHRPGQSSYGSSGASGEYGHPQQTPVETGSGSRALRGQGPARSPSVDWRLQYAESQGQDIAEAQTSRTFCGKDEPGHIADPGTDADGEAALAHFAPLREISTTTGTATATATATAPAPTTLFAQTQAQPQDEQERQKQVRHPAPASAPASAALASYLASTPARPPRRVIRDGGRDERPQGNVKGSGGRRSSSKTRARTRPSTAGSK